MFAEQTPESARVRCPMSVFDHSSDKLRNARDVFAGWLREWGSGGTKDFEELCALHPGLVPELQSIHSAFKLGQAVASSRSLRDTLGEQFGEAEELTVRLEEWPSSGDLPSGDRTIGPVAADGSNRTGRYALEDEIARDGMGVILRVRDRELSRTLAMKVPADRPGAAPSATDASIRLGLARFLEEAQVTAQLDHPGIVPVHEVGFDERGQAFFTMKLVKGRELGEIFKLARAEKEDWNLLRALGAVVKACQALAYAHAKGVIHRDLKPANIMVGRFGEVFVMDWGLAKITGKKDLHDIRPKDTQLTSASLHSPRRQAATESTPDSPLITMDGSVVGTPAYMPPEQALGQVDEVDQASDIYSLGAILYNLLTGQPPYVEPAARISPHTILGMVIQGAPKSVHQLNPQAPPELVAICEKAMAREKKDRYVSSLHLAEDLQAFLDHRVVRAYRTGAVAEFKSWVKRNKPLAYAAAAVTVLGLSGMAGFIWQQNRANERLRLNLYIADMRVAHEALKERNRGQAAKLLNKYLQREGGDDLRGFEWRYLWKLSQGREQFTLTGHSSRVLALAFGSDGKTLFSGGFGESVRMWDLASRSSLAAIPVNLGSIRSIAVSPNGKALMIGADYGVVVREGPSFADERLLAKAFGWLALSPDGTTLVTGGNDGIMIWDANNCQKLQTLSQALLGAASPDDLAGLAFSADGTTFAAAVLAHSGIEVSLWNVSSLRTAGNVQSPLILVKPGKGPAGVPHMSLTFSRDGRVLATATVSTGGWLLQLWNSHSGKLLASTDCPAVIMGITFLADGKTIVTSSWAQDLQIWDISTGTNIAFAGSVPAHGNEVWALAQSPNGKTLATGCKDGTIKVWAAETFLERPRPVDLIEEKETGSFGKETGWFGFAEEGRRIITFTGNRTLSFWDSESLAKLKSEPVTLAIKTSALSPDGGRVAAVLTDGAVQIWTVSVGQKTPVPENELLPSQSGLSAPVLRWAPSGRFLAARLGDVYVWEVATRQLVGRVSFSGQPDPLALSPDGRILAVGTVPKGAQGFRREFGHAGAAGAFNGTVELWDVTSRKRTKAWVASGEWINGLAFSPDGKVLASVSMDNTAKLWDVPSGRLNANLTSHTVAVFDAAFSPDGRTLATAGGDSLKLWNVETGQELMTLEHHDSDRVLFSPDDRTLVFRNDLGLSVRSAPSLVEIEAAEAPKAPSR
jgi:WD40 repeat protein/serine/threonine protein kinase